MFIFVAIIIVVLGSAVTIHGDTNSYVSCQMQGDPRLTPFSLVENASVMTNFCALRNVPLTFFRNRYVKIQVVNNGGSSGNIVSFTVSLLDESDSINDVCTFTEQYFKYYGHSFTCGLATIVINNNNSMEIQNREADLFVIIRNESTNYNVIVKTSWENANSSKGMCRDGCIDVYTINARSSLVRPIPQDQVTSSLAKPICDIYLKEYIKPSASIPNNLIEYVKQTHQGCVTNVMNMGVKEYAQQALLSIISTIMTFNATSLEQIRVRTHHASALASQLGKVADQVTTQLIANYRAQNLINN